MYQFTKYPKERLDLYSLSQPTKDFLNMVGLPSRSFYFEDFDGVYLPKLSEFPELNNPPPDEFSNMPVLGSYSVDFYHNPVCLVEGNEEVIILDRETFAKILVNSSVFQLVGALNDYSEFVEEVLSWEDVGGDAFREGRYGEELVVELENKIKENDPIALEHGNYWANEIESLRERMKHGEKLGRYTFAVDGKVSRYDEFSIPLKEVFFVADPPVLREIANFLNACADGIDQYGEGWEHEHLFQHWDEWYSLYPEVTVYRPQKRKTETD